MTEQQARRLVRERSAGVCEVCGSETSTNFHHRQNRSAGGRWRASNGLGVCGSGTTGCHGWITTHPGGAAARGWIVWSWQTPPAVPVLHATWGLVLLDDTGCLTPHYP